MKRSRRDVLCSGLGLAATVAVPEIIIPSTATGYSHAEVDARMESGKGMYGLAKADLVTPALLLDLDLLEANIAKMAAHAKAAKINLRPHGKTHKCPQIAERQIKAGAIGLCMATIREAEAMSAAGIKNLFITCELVGKPKIERLIKLTRRAPETMSAVDSSVHAQQLSDAAVAAKIKLNVMMDVDPAGRRTGVPPGDAAIRLAEQIVKMPNLKLRGIHGYSGMSAHVNTFEARRNHSTKVMTPVLETFQQLKKMGLGLEIMSGGSTGTYNIDCELGRPGLAGMTELQTGSYVFMDVEYRAIGGKSGAVYEDFASSLTVMATVISKSYSDHATTDAGIKAFASDKPKHLPEIKGATGVTLGYGGDEHGILMFNNSSRDFNIGDRIEFIVPHCDPNVNLYDRIYCVRGENVVDVWKTAGRYGD
ncbi:MAG: DSD1 family PLP-dependent enzyme [Acidobacteriota bacterium]|nr:DSD1 family PLP-dependent enzyme [Acidobacteriota bacterium]